MDRELRAHLDLCAEDLVTRGIDPLTAREEAERRFGDLARISDECRIITRSRDRAVRRAHIMEGLVQDLKFALRSFRRSPAFAFVAVLTIALGIGANTGIFTVLNRVLLTPLPYPDADRIVTIWERDESGSTMHIAGANFQDWADQSRSFEAMAVHPSYAFGGRTTILGGTHPAQAWLASVSKDFFTVMGVQPMLGRTFSADDSRQNTQPVTVVSHSFWQNVLGSPENLSGVTVQAFSNSAEVIGVMPPDFSYPQDTELWIPAELFGPINASPARDAHNHAVTARLAEGVSLAEARADLDQITARLKAEYGEDMDAVGAVITPLQKDLVGGVRGPLLLLMFAAGLVLLIASANVASTLLARATQREQEISVRAALGAGRRRLVRQLLTESVFLSLAGATVGLLLGTVIVRSIVASSPDVFPVGVEIGLDPRVLIFTVVITGITTVLFGLLPALRSTNKDGGRSLARNAGIRIAGGNTRAWNLLVGSEVALSLILLMGSGLLLKSLWTVLNVDAGMDPERVVTASVSLPTGVYPDDEARARFYSDILRLINELSEVEAAGLTNNLPLDGNWLNGGLEFEDFPEGVALAPDYRIASEQYFGSLGIGLLRGRLFSDQDNAGVEDVAIINQRFADRVWPNGDPVGKRVRNLANDSFIYEDAHWIRIVGVVDDVSDRSLTQTPRPAIYVHYLQRPARASSATLTIRTALGAESVAAEVRNIISAAGPQVPVEFSTMDEVVGTSVSVRRFTAQVLSSFALLALVLSCIGVYGVVSYSVARRTKEMGIRLALGADPGGLLKMIIARSMQTIALGLAVGLVTAGLLSRTVQNLLFEVSALDPMTFLAVTMFLALAALAATYLPARRTTMVNPVRTIQSD